MKINVNKEDVFSSRGATMAIAATSAGYTLNYSVDGVNWSAYEEAVPANENLVVTDMVQGMYFKLVGNADDNVIVKF